MPRTLGSLCDTVYLFFAIIGSTGPSHALESIKEKYPPPNLIVVRSVLLPELKNAKPGFVLSYGLTQKDREACTRLDDVKYVVPMRIFPSGVRRAERFCSIRVVATTEEYARVETFEVGSGRFLKASEDEPKDKEGVISPTNVVVLGAAVAKALFPFEEPVGKEVVLQNMDYKVIGVIKERLPKKGKPDGEDHNHDVYLSLAVSKRRLGETLFFRVGGMRTAERVELHQLLVVPKDPARLEPLADDIRKLLKANHEKPDWEVKVR